MPPFLSEGEVELSVDDPRLLRCAERQKRYLEESELLSLATKGSYSPNWGYMLRSYFNNEDRLNTRSVNAVLVCWIRNEGRDVTTYIMNEIKFYDVSQL
jgi:hypothetical protein